MKKHSLNVTDIICLVVALLVAFSALVMSFGFKFSGTLTIYENGSSLTISRGLVSILVILFCVFLSFSIRNFYPAYFTATSKKIADYSGIAFLIIAGFNDLMMVFFAAATSMTDGKGRSPIGLVNYPIIALSVSIFTVFMLLRFTAFKKKDINVLG